MILAGRSWSGQERNCVYLNLGQQSERFANISYLSGLDFLDDSRAVCVLDWDHDGDLDLWFGNRSAPRVRLMRNEASRDAGGFIALKLEGNGTTTNRDAIGARVEVTVKGDGDLKRIKTLRAGEGFLSQSSKWLHFGLGPEPGVIEKVSVRWPRRGVDATEHFDGLEPNHHYVLREGGGAERWEPPVRTLSTIQPERLHIPEPEQNLHIPALTLYQAPDVVYQMYDGELAKVDTTGIWTWLNLWATWCAPCLKELQVITEHAADLEAANVNVVALAVDGLDPDAKGFDSTAVKTALENVGYPFTGGLATEQLVAAYQEIADALITLKLDIPVPTSFLINPNGQVVAMYKGTVDIDALLEDAAVEARSLEERWVRATGLGGSCLPHERVRETIRNREAQLLFTQAHSYQEFAPHLSVRGYRNALKYDSDFDEARQGLAEQLEKLDRFGEAESEARRVLEGKDTHGLHARAHYLVSLCNLKQGQIPDALASLEETVRLDPDHANGLNNLAYLLGNNRNLPNHDPERALVLAERAVRATSGRDANHLDTLAVLYTGLGRLDDAVETMKRAIAATTESGDAAAKAKYERKLAALLTGQRSQDGQ